MTRDEYCGTCHSRIHKVVSLHSRHSPLDVQCVDCHTPQVTDGGQRYSIHDHKFDFSGPEYSCTECHEERDTKGKNTKNHNFHRERVRLPETLTLEQACARCHPDKDVAQTLSGWKYGSGGK
jgi:formate-dependent nitrite reductase cytochrome c552 subunit